MSANKLNNDILEGISQRFNGSVIAWRNNRLVAKAIGRGGKIRTVSAGIDGQGDITGILPDGRRLEIETKTTDYLSTSQKSFKAMIEKHGGVYIVARDHEKCLRDIDAEIKAAGIVYRPKYATL